MSLVSGPGRGGTVGEDHEGLPDSRHLAVDNHVKYIQSLDKVRSLLLPVFYQALIY